MRRAITPLVLLMFIITIAACGGKKKPTPTPSPTPVPKVTTRVTPATATPVPATATSTVTAKLPTATVEAVPTTAEEPALSEAVQALNNLKSYRVRTTMEEQTTYPDESTKGSLTEVLAEVINRAGAQPDQHLVITGSLGTDEENRLEVYEVGDQSWIKLEEQWMQMPRDQEQGLSPAALPWLDPTTFLGGLKHLERVRPDEEVNGIKAEHYRFDEADFLAWLKREAEKAGQEEAPSSDMKALHGDLWIATDSGYVVKYVLEGDIEDTETDEAGEEIPVQRHVRLTYEVSDVNKSFTIEPPTSSAASIKGFAEGEFPMPEDVTVEMMSPEFAAMSTAMATEDVAKFYDEALLPLGWTKNEEESMSSGNMSALVYTKDNLQLSVTISPDEASGQTKLLIAVSEK
ncbi:MAG TPA: hypothetical protein EYP04_06515 [Anaerolineae bacterium]|nr:hypothetical protein [Anaerolineae bacterium]